MKEELDNIISVINSHSDWSKNVKIRYAYISLGRLVHKDAMFFYTIQNNLLSSDKEDIRYSDDEIKRMINTENLFDYKVVCRNSADMLVYILNKCGIESEVRKTLVTTKYKDLIINHYFVIATGDDDKKYFMTLNPDLPNIKLGRKTSKFAYEIKYIIDSNITEEKNGDKQYYEGEEVDYSTMSDEEIRKLDEQIGYLEHETAYDDGTYGMEYTDYFFDMMINAYKDNSEYKDGISHETNFYYIISKMLNEGKTLDQVLKERPNLNKGKDIYLDFKISDIPNEVWSDIKDYILNSFISKVFKEYGIRSDVDYEGLLKEKKYDDIRNLFNQDLTAYSDKEKINKLGDNNPFFVMKRITDLFKTIDIFSSKELNKINAKDNKEKFAKNLSRISLYFVDRKLLPNEGSLSSTYLTNKLIFAFKNIFDIGHKTKFNEVTLAEQVIVIKEILTVVLSDINKKDYDIPNYNDQKSPLRNRIISTVIFEKETRRPYYLIYVKNTKYADNANVMLVYDLIDNELYLDKSPIDIMSDYYVIKDADMKLIIEEFNTKDIDTTENFKL